VQIKAQFFSQLKEVTGSGERIVTLPEGSTVGDLLTQLYRQCPGLENWDNSILVGAGVEFVRRDRRLQPGESIAIMPPVQGG
jgi:molybdopterin converting factor small subunit